MNEPIALEGKRDVDLQSGEAPRLMLAGLPSSSMHDQFDLHSVTSAVHPRFARAIHIFT